jgi:hypothetical protein
VSLAEAAASFAELAAEPDAWLSKARAWRAVLQPLTVTERQPVIEALESYERQLASDDHA